MKEWDEAESLACLFAEFVMNAGLANLATVQLMWDAAERAGEARRRAKARLEAQRSDE